jgi:hypothetical protein
MPIRLSPAELILIYCLICGGGLTIVAAVAVLAWRLVRKQ